MICIDPGVKACGVAIFYNGTLSRAFYAPKEKCKLAIWEPMIIEMPRIYPGSGQQKGDLNDLLNLAAVVGYFEGSTGDVKRVFPSEWKGNVPKPIMTKRILSRLTVEESTRIENAGAKTHNIIDAVGIGLWKLGRL